MFNSYVWGVIMKKIKKIISIVMIMMFLTTFTAIPVFGDIDTDINNTQNSIDSSKKNAEIYNDKVDSLEDKITEQQKQAKLVEGEISTVDADIKGTQIKINDTQDKINTATNELNKAIEDYNKQDEAMKQRINAMYKNGTTMGYMELIFNSKSFTDFLSKTEIMKRIINYDMNMLDEMNKKREEIEEKKVQLEASKTELDTLNESLKTKKAELVDKKQSLNNMLASINKQIADYKYLIQQEQATQEKLLKDLNYLIAKKKYSGTFNGDISPILHKSDFPNGVSPVISSPFGYRLDPFTGIRTYHSGLDIATRGYQNIPVYALAAGRVVLSEYYSGYGYCVIIDHGSGMSSLYAHNNKLLVSEGQVVNAGQNIALSGSTGRSTGPHIHFEVQKNGQPIDPEPYYILGY